MYKKNIISSASFCALIVVTSVMPLLNFFFFKGLGLGLSEVQLGQMTVHNQDTWRRGLNSGPHWQVELHKSLQYLTNLLWSGF